MKRSWSWREWLPNADTLTLIGVTTTGETAVVVVEADGPSCGRCPSCSRRSDARHSRYWRTLKDLATQGRSVTLRVRVTRWRCRNRRCATAIFADRLIGVSAPRVHHTQRFGAVVHLVGHALGGRGGERLLARLGMAISDDTILRVLKGSVIESPAPGVLQVVGLDDWAWQKGHHHYGTIFIDLQRRRVVDVLGVRTADAVAAWLAAHPGIVIISRDRHGPYAEAVRRGAPQATQVADRFHLILNLRGAVEQELSRVRPRLTVVQPVSASAVRSRQARVGPRSPVARYHVEVIQERRTAQAQRFAVVKRLQASGLTGQAIMRETGISRGTLRKWLRASELPPRKRMAPRPGMPDFYREHLRRRWTEGCQDGRRLMAEIQALGFVGCYSGLARLLAPWRDPAQEPLETDTDSASNTAGVPDASDDAHASVYVRHVSPRQAAALLSQPRPLLTARQAEIVDGLKARCPGFTTMRRLVLSFRTILRVGKVNTLHRWLARAQATSIRPLQRFVKTLRHDLEAVEGAVTQAWSNGPVEGHINRLKTLRRQMYGRAGVELLRARLLPLPTEAGARW